MTTLSLGGTWEVQIGDLTPGQASRPTEDTSAWQEMVVPSNWWLQGRDWSGSVWFRRRFAAMPHLQGQVVKLAFGGVDYAAAVWLNGHYLGAHEGYFQPFSFVISDFLHMTAENVLVVRVDSPSEEPGKAWSLHKRLIKGIFSHHDTRPGGAWSLRGQEQNTGGIWGPVSLQISSQVTIDTVRVTPQWPQASQPVQQGQTAYAAVAFTVTHHGQQPRDFQVDLQLIPHNFLPEAPTGSQQTIVQRLSPGVHHLTVTLVSPHTHLWWPWEHGRPDLYRVEVAIRAENMVLDHSATTFGFRTIEGSPEAKGWRFNGRRMFLRGTNYIASQWLSEMSPEKYAFDLALMRRAHINVIRVHAHIAAPAFYQLCDEAGMLVWQDFPLQWGYTDDAAFITEAVRQAHDMVTLLDNHPAIIAWSLHNEPPWDAPWMRDKYSDYDPHQNKHLDARLLASVRTADPTRYLHPYSATAEHPWLGWYSGVWQDYGKPTQQALISEFGAQALPSLSALRRIVPETALWPTTEAAWRTWDYHNFQRKETFEIAQVPMGHSIETFIHNTQHYQQRLLQFAAESYRRQRFQPVVGIFQFMFVESWPSMNWGIVDFWRQPKTGYQALQTAYQPVLPSIAWDREVWQQGEAGGIELWVINDLWQRFPDATLTSTLRQNEAIVDQQAHRVHIEPDSSVKVHRIATQTLAPASYELAVALTDQHHTLLGHNAFRFRIDAGTAPARR
jgi:beta-mannosidase